MTRTSLIALTLVALLCATTHAQPQPSQEPAAWQAMAATLPAGAFVEIRLKDGRRFRGAVLERGAEALIFKPKTRVPVPAAEIAFRDIDSIEARTPGMSPGKKVVIGVASALAGAVILGLAGLAASN